MTNSPRISEAEWEVMKVIWSKSPLTANEIIDTLKENTKWSPKTIRTLIRRLVEKEVLDYHQEGRLYAYFPLVSEEDGLRRETQSFLKRVYGGAMKPFLVHFMREEKLSPEDISELKKLLDEQQNSENRKKM